MKIKGRVDLYFQRTIYPMLTPMMFDNTTRSRVEKQQAFVWCGHKS